MRIRKLVRDDEMLARTQVERAGDLSPREHLLRFDLRHWINNGLMAVFFFAVGLEIKREFLVGELAEPRQAMLPIAAAIGGMVIGKPLGICVASWLAVKTGLATLPEGVSWRHVTGTAFLAGIGFTMALFISGLAFPGTDLEREAKLGILIGSLVSAAVGVSILLTTQWPAKRDLDVEVPL